MDMQSKAKKLIEMIQTAPVEWKPLGEVGLLVRGNGLQKKDFTESGVPAIHYGQIYTYYGNQTDKTLSFVSPELAEKLKKVDKGDVVITNTSENIEDVGKALLYLGEEQAVTGGHATIFKPSKEIVGKFFVYFTQTEIFDKAKRKFAKGTKVIDVSATDMAKIQIPIPPLETQQKIVKILDKFTELEATLEAELALRKRQYRYYRDFLLDFDNQIGGWIADGYQCRLKDVVWKTLGEVFNIFAGGDVPKDAFSEVETEEFCIPILSNGIGSKALYGWTNVAKINQPSLTISARGTIGWASFQNKPFFPIVRLLVLTPKIELNLKYAYYFMKSIESNYKVPESGIPQLTKPMIKDISIPIPPLPEQEKIVAILDKFDTLTHSISEGLPHEIALRRKQYEYYREQLLAFR
ncbi:restriction endonuclease subunit S [Neisseria meningitidis]|uniref:restriction endonuclease subunit S n=1 Tax=Neisseria meningitidis TaxID=487 RepID=UPI000FCB5E7D|nr:restriction endonuclease subunit S [Neisseria meningitidis]